MKMRVRPLAGKSACTIGALSAGPAPVAVPAGACALLAGRLVEGGEVRDRAEVGFEVPHWRAIPS